VERLQVFSEDNALSAASAGGHLEVAKLLIHHGAEVNAQGGSDYGDALSAASAGGYLEVVELLIHHGAKVNSQAGFYGNALSAASHTFHSIRLSPPQPLELPHLHLPDHPLLPRHLPLQLQRDHHLL
jgi:hypothetical protein